MFTLWNRQADQLEPQFAKNNYRPKSQPIENAVFSDLGRGNWTSCLEKLYSLIEWKRAPWELVCNADIQARLGDHVLKGKSSKIEIGDPPLPAILKCMSATDLKSIDDESLDIIVTDPPFGDLIQYAEMADFFYVWLRIGLKGV